MTRGAEKWAAKLSGDNRKRLYDTQKERMARLEKEATESLVKIEQEVKQIVMGESILHVPYYIIFGKEIFRLKQHHREQTLINEAIILEQKWESRGLDNSLLEEIKKFYIPAYEIPGYFRFDVSLLDGTDVLS